MSEELASVIWSELKRYINTVDRVEAAENLISILIDNDCNPDDIKDAFKGDAEFKRAMANYLDTGQDDQEVEEEEEEDFTDFETDDWEE